MIEINEEPRLTMRCRLDTDVEYPNDCINVLRSRPFRFAARKCNKWAMGRVILCGDAAHVFPPCNFTLPRLYGIQC